jgi:hypothetical protein
VSSDDWKLTIHVRHLLGPFLQTSSATQPAIVDITGGLLYFTAHAKQRMTERSLSEADVNEALVNVQKREAARDQCLMFGGCDVCAQFIPRISTRVVV